MAVYRVERTRDYTVMSNHHLKDTNLSLKAKGLLSLMLSLPDDWNFNMRGLSSICKEGLEAIGNALKELEKAGYMVRNQLRGANGRITDTEYIIYERPQEPAPADPDTASPYTPPPDTTLPYPGNPDVVEPDMADPSAENPALLNTKKSNTKKLNIYLSNHGAADNKPDNKPDSSRAYYPEDARLNEAFKAFVYMRKRINKPLTSKAVGLTKESLAQMAAGEDGKLDIEKAIGILNQSVMNSWSGLYALKPVQDKNRGQPYNLSEEDWQNLEKQVLAN